MEKNGSAARVRKGGKAQDLTSPDGSGSAANSTTALDQGAADGQKGDAGSPGSTSQVADSSPVPDLDAASNQVDGKVDRSESMATAARIMEAAGISTAGLAGAGLTSTSYAMGGVISVGTQLVGESSPELRLDLSALGNLGASGGKSNPDEAAGTGESFDKMLADSFRNTAGLKVTSKQAGFRRAGRAWSTTPTVIALSELDDDQIRLLKAEPMLSVELVDLEDEDF